MIIECQQQNILKIGNKIPGHGPQEVRYRWRPFSFSERVLLGCGCSIPIPWLPLKEQQRLNP